MNIVQAAALLGIAIPVVAGMDFFIRWYCDSHRKALQIQGKQLLQRNADLEQRIRELPTGHQNPRTKIPPPNWISPDAARLIRGTRTAFGEEQKRARSARDRPGTSEEALHEEQEATAANTSTRFLAEVSVERTLTASRCRGVREADAISRAHNRRDASSPKGESGPERCFTASLLRLSPERRAHCHLRAEPQGGVGRPTLTAYLAWAMVRKGYRVLLIDLDLQGSLSSLFLSAGDLAKRSEDGLVLRDYHCRRRSRENSDAKPPEPTPCPVARFSTARPTFSRQPISLPTRS